MSSFADRVPGVRHALAVAHDGLVLASSRELSVDRADTAAAISSGLVSMSNSSAKLLHGGTVKLTLVEMSEGFLFLMAFSNGSSLVAWAEAACDVGLVGYELALLADRVGGALTPQARAAAPGVL